MSGTAKAGTGPTVVVPEGPPVEPATSGAEPFRGLAPGRIVAYTDVNQKPHAAVVGFVNPGQSWVVNLVVFGAHAGDEPADLIQAVRFSADGHPHTWRWPERA